MYQFCDSFDHYNNAALLYEFTSGTMTYSSSFARFAPPSGLPGQGMKTAAGPSYVRKNMKSNAGTFIIFVAVNLGSLGNPGPGGNPFLSVYDSGRSQWSLVVFSSGAIGIIKGGAGAVQVQTGPG